MKGKRIIFGILMFLPLAVVLAALPFLPDQIPAHYGFDNQVTRWGSKYEALLLPILTIVLGLFLLAMARYAAKHEESGKNNENVCLITGIVSLALFNLMTAYFLYTDFHKVENLSEAAFDVNQLIFGFFGLCMLIIGNVMPKLRMNSMIGLRTSWSMKNEQTWKKSQRFGGISSIISGILMILASLMTRGLRCFMLCMGILVICLIVDVIYTRQIAKKYEKSGNQRI
ncbi:MAG: SdpI family protein [Lachnospiraceae bacterium]